MATQDQMPQFNLDEIPNSSLMVLLSIIHQEATEYLKQPGIQEKYNQWLKKRKADKSATKELK